MKRTNWTKATDSVQVAIGGLFSCLEYKKNAWLEVQKNGEQDYPAVMKNPALDDFRNWTSSYGVPRNEEDLAKRNWFNDTEKALTLDFVHVFGTAEAVERYYSEGIVTADNFKSGGVSHSVKIEDWNLFMQEHDPKRVIENGKTSWVWFYTPKKHVPHWVPDPNVPNVFVVCFDDEPVDRSKALKRASEFLAFVAEKEDN